MPKINVLSKHVAELIAAGEVVERPASVVKELMENSIDAGATSITLEIRNGGVTYIRITDNGCGIEHDDVPKAFISHATSKIADENDLNSIFTLGFRGEALASIAAVSRTEILTRAENEQTGTSYAVEGGVETRFEQAGCPQGTTIIVRDLFFNTPARMKFLKRDVSEANAVAEIVDRIALSNPGVSIRFIREGKQALITPGDGKTLSAIYSVFGRAFADSLVEVNYELEGIRVEGYVCKPAFSRPSRSMQYFFLNGRYFKSRSCMASMENAYKNSIMVGKFPSCVLNIVIAPNFVDVNVHPAKTEVRFSDERRVTSAVYYAVKSAIEASDTPVVMNIARVAEKTRAASSQLLLAVEDEPVSVIKPQTAVPVQKPVQSKPDVTLPVKEAPVAQRKKDFRTNISSSEYKAAVSSPKSESPVAQSKQEPDLIASFKAKNQPPKPSQPASRPAPGEYTPPSHSFVPVRTEQELSEAAPKPLRLLGEAFKTYIICEYDNKVYFIDKHAAHERVIYNKIKKAAENKVSSQVLLSPVTVTLNKNDYNTVLENLDVFSKAGYLVEDFGTGVVIVRECPMLISGDDIEDTVVEIASYLVQNRTNVESEKIDRIHHTSACKAAIKAGYKNSTAEMKVLAEQVLYDDEIRYCPHGRPVLIEMSRYDLEKQFGRIQ
ncbi:MAG: DNA mismatch repair endonuclease MutL [Ruminococcaceae bacterium]|nr:DNA mismatch repair endonuclease MutL [Oscillospiraceae bacterium]